MAKKTPKRTGAPSKLTPDLIAEICTVVRAGNYIDVACQYMGITDRTYHNWMKWGEEEATRIDDGGEADPHKELYVQFFREASRARADAQARSVARLRALAAGQVRGMDGEIDKAVEVDARVRADVDKWFLERSFTDKWGRRQMRIEHTGKDGGPIATTPVFDLSKLTDEELDAFEALTQKAAGKESEE